MRYFILFYLLLTGVFATAQKQGIKGKVEWVSGNQMPGPNKPEAHPQGIKREIYIYQATAITQTSQQDAVFFSDIKTQRVRKIRSKKNGNFRVRLPAGKYSIFVKEPHGLFANTFDGQNCIQCVQVNSGEYATVTIQVNYEAAY